MSEELALVENKLAAIHRDIAAIVVECEAGSMTPGAHHHALARIAALEDQAAKLEQQRLRLRDQHLTQEQVIARTERSYWFQRLNTSLAIAHGAGFAAVTAHLFDPSTTAEVAGLSLPSMATFGLGALVAGAIPLPLAFERRRIANGLLAAAASLFILAIFLSVKAAWLKSVARLWIWQP